MGYHIISIEPLVQLTGLEGPVIRLLTGIFIAYPLALIYSLTLYKKNPNLQHVSFTVCGLSLAVFLYGLEGFHTLVAIIVQYMIIQVIGPNYVMVLISFVFQMAYLVIGYVVYSTESYDIDWTVAQCILTLRLIGVAWDRYDGAQDMEKLPKDNKETALSTSPGLLEMMGHTYFFGSFVVGPQFPMSRYLAFVKGTLVPPELDQPSVKINKGLLRLAAGVVYLTIHAVLETQFYNDFLISKEFEIWSLVRKLLYITLWGKILLCKYIAVWLIAEGSCIMTGLSYNGKTETGEARWDALKNFKITIHETAITLQSVIDSFNVNTNLWMSKYVFKRLRFLGNKTVSHMTTLLFLALWHGIYIGYFINFIFEYFYVNAERQFHSMLAPFEERIDPKGLLFKIRWITMYFVKTLILSYCLVAFSLLSWSKVYQVYSTTYFVPHLILIAWIVFYHFIYPSLRSPQKKKD